MKIVYERIKLRNHEIITFIVSSDGSGGGAGKFLQPCANEDDPVGGERGSDINMVAER